jgi:hypothetical protein
MANKQPDPDAVLADALGMVVARLRAEWKKEKAVIVAEARAVIAEVKLAAAEAALAEHSPEKAAKLRAIGGGR